MNKYLLSLGKASTSPGLQFSPPNQPSMVVLTTHSWDPDFPGLNPSPLLVLSEGILLAREIHTSEPQFALLQMEFITGPARDGEK